MKVKAIVQLPDGRQEEVVAEPVKLSYIDFGGPENPMALEDLQIISIEIVEAYHGAPQALKVENIDLTKMQKHHPKSYPKFNPKEAHHPNHPKYRTSY
jgi:hypothetical protein